MEENTVVIGCDVYAPYTYKDGTGDFIGIDVQLAHEAFGRLGYDVEFREIAWENKDKALASGEVDCIWSCFTMNGREDVYTWAGPYLYSRQVALVRADSDYTELSQLNGGRAAVQASTTAENALVKRESAVAPELAQVLCFSTIGEAVSALRKGYVDVVVAHESVIQSVVHGSPEKYRILDQALFANELGVAFEKGTHGRWPRGFRPSSTTCAGTARPRRLWRATGWTRKKNAGGELMRRVFEKLRGLHQRKVMKRFAWLRFFW